MKSCLPIGIEALLGGAVETGRLEFKATWDQKVTGPQVIRTLCAFANDLQGLNGGYVVVGIAESEGAAVRPVRGLTDRELDDAQKWVRGHCMTIDPIYMPVPEPVEVDGRRVLVLWAPASDTRPHLAPADGKGQRRYWVRIGSETVEAQGEILTALMQQTARVPFDDRRAVDAVNEDISLSLVREFLRDVHSDLVDEPDAERVYRAMRIVTPTNGHTAPRNVALLFFSNDPERWFRGARIEVVEFPDEAGGDASTEKIFRGPLHEQVRQCLSWLEGMTTRYLEKVRNAPESRGWVSFPRQALREAVVNAVYHRGYQDAVEPTKIHLYPDRIEIVSYPGPVPGIEARHLEGAALPPPVPARNRRIGEFLKELRLAEGRGTGLPKIRRSLAENGSPAPRFDFDPGRSYFRTTLPAHPEYVVLSVLRDFAYKKATGDSRGARELLARAWRDGTRSPSLAVELVRQCVEGGDPTAADSILDSLDPRDRAAYARAFTVLASAHAEAGNSVRSQQLMDLLPMSSAAEDLIEAAVLERRLGRDDKAHHLFECAGEEVTRDARALHEFAQAKLRLTAPLAKSGRSADAELRARLLKESIALLGKVVAMPAPEIRRAWAWYDLGRALRWRGAPEGEIREAFESACRLAPGEARFQAALATLRRSS